MSFPWNGMRMQLKRLHVPDVEPVPANLQHIVGSPLCSEQFAPICLYNGCVYNGCVYNGSTMVTLRLSTKLCFAITWKVIHSVKL